MGADQRVDNFLIRRLKGVPRARIYRMIRSGEVRVNKSRVRASSRLEAGDTVRIPPVRSLVANELPQSDIKKHEYLLDRVIFEDDSLLALDKPSGLAVHAGSGISFGLIELMRKLHPGGNALELCHRLDKETSGVLIFSKKPLINKKINELFKQKTDSDSTVEKRYIALLKGRVSATRKIEHKLFRQARKDGERLVVVHPDGVPAVSTFRPLVHFDDFATLAEVDLHTGRTHQVRVHAQSMGHPVAGDLRYGDKRFNRILHDKGLSRLFLHAARLNLPHPETGEKLVLNAPVPGPLEQVTVLLERADKQ